MKELRALKRVFKLKKLKQIYEQMLKIAQDNNIKVLNERQFYNFLKDLDFNIEKISEPILVLKHDVDRMLSPIAKIHEIERKYNVSSTYHVRADERQYSLNSAKKVFAGKDVALHLVGELEQEKERFEKFFPNVIGCSTHGGFEKEFVFNEELLDELSKHFEYVSDGLLRPKEIGLDNKFLLIPIDSADIYFEGLVSKLNIAIRDKKIMILNTHVEYFTPFEYLKRQFIQLVKIGD